MLTLVHGWVEDAERWLASVRSFTSDDHEALLVDNSGTSQVARRLQQLASDESVRLLTLKSPVGWADAANRGLEAAAGEVVILFDPGVELSGDVAGPLLAAVRDRTVAVAGAYGVRSEGQVGHFHSHAGPDVDAIEGYVLAFRRAEVLAAGGFDRRFKFYRLADFELCFRLRDRLRARAILLPGLPVVRHEHRLWEALGEDERERLSRRNFYRFQKLWGSRKDLLTTAGQ